MSLEAIFSSSSLALSTATVVVLLFSANYLFYVGLGLIASNSNGSNMWTDVGNRARFSRYLVDLIAMSFFSVVGFLAMSEFGGSLIPVDSMLQHTRVGSYTYNLILIQLSYEIKSLIDAFLYGDDLIYVGHHAATGLLAYLALDTGFSQKYSPFFFGISEISTAAVCVLVCFDKKRGVIGLAAAYPAAEVLSGVVFAALFIVCRIIVWPYVSFYFWMDSLAVLRDGRAPSDAVVYLFLVTNALLSVLQIAWLGEIIQGAVVLFGNKEKKNDGQQTKKIK